MTQRRRLRGARAPLTGVADPAKIATCRYSIIYVAVDTSGNSAYDRVQAIN
jgi:hypothetical protein